MLRFKIKWRKKDGLFQDNLGQSKVLFFSQNDKYFVLVQVLFFGKIIQNINLGYCTVHLYTRYCTVYFSYTCDQ